jgi:hypothetical protein
VYGKRVNKRNKEEGKNDRETCESGFGLRKSGIERFAGVVPFVMPRLFIYLFVSRLNLEKII